ncbi:hypothetical protein JCM3766R1_005665 [Sporobolomyces carnicolor]
MSRHRSPTRARLRESSSPEDEYRKGGTDDETGLGSNPSDARPRGRPLLRTIPASRSEGGSDNTDSTRSVLASSGSESSGRGEQEQDDDDSQLFKSINRLFSESYQRDPRFPSPPRHHSPDAVPRSRHLRHRPSSSSPSHSHSRVPPSDDLDRSPYVRPSVLGPFSDLYDAREHHQAHLVSPIMATFLADLTVALELVELERETWSPGRPLYGTHFSTPEYPDERDPSGLWRPRETTAPPTSEYASSSSSSSSQASGNGNGNRAGGGTSLSLPRDLEPIRE